MGCKGVTGANVPFSFSAFYLNYVGCKGIESNDWNAASCSFTLTMWDVKSVILEIGLKDDNVLP